MGLEFVCELATLRCIYLGPFLMVQWLGLGTFCAVGPDLIPGLGTKIPQVAQYDQKKIFFNLISMVYTSSRLIFLK